MVQTRSETILVKYDYSIVKDYCGFEKEEVHDGIDALNELNLWAYFAHFRPKEGEGFMWTRDPKIEKLKELVDKRGIHSGASLGILLRILHKIAKEQILSI